MIIYNKKWTESKNKKNKKVTLRGFEPPSFGLSYNLGITYISIKDRCAIHYATRS